MKKGIRGLLILLTLLSCNSPGNLSPANYTAYLENPEHDFCRKVVVGNNEYTIQLAPAEYMVCKETEQSDSSKRIMAARLKELDGTIFFLIKIGATKESRIQQGGKRTSEEQINANAKVSYYDQLAVKDISLENGEQMIYPSTYVFENNYDLSPFNTIVVGFDAVTTENLKLTFNDRYTGVPAIRASFSKEQLTKLPKLTF
ncbi:MAG: hypothetical protein WC716_15865 [Chitinophagaceae bacterium]|jgi:hypothetical protein